MKGTRFYNALIGAVPLIHQDQSPLISVFRKMERLRDFTRQPEESV
jgi:hypothetical protein